MITGYNTDVEFDGVVYHVQTEDKGLQTPIILSLVYSGGAILASKRAPYEDLIAAGFDEAVLAERLDRQHKLICAAVHAGRLEDLKRMSGRAAAKKAPRGGKSIQLEDSLSGAVPAKAPEIRPEVGNVSQDRIPIAEVTVANDSLRIMLLEERELRAGEFVTLRVQVVRATPAGETPVHRARVVLKTLGTTFKPASTFSITDRHGVASVFASLPAFDTGRAAILLRAESDGETAELRRIVLPASAVRA